MEPKQNSTAKIVIALFLLILGCCCITGIISSAVIAYFNGVEKTYYPECEMVAGVACKSCCETKGHNGYVTGAWASDADDGRICGCL